MLKQKLLLLPKIRLHSKLLPPQRKLKQLL